MSEPDDNPYRSPREVKLGKRPRWVGTVISCLIILGFLLFIALTAVLAVAVLGGMTPGVLHR